MAAADTEVGKEDSDPFREMAHGKGGKNEASLQTTAEPHPNSKITVVDELQEVAHDGHFRTKRGLLVKADTLIWCTGYSYSFPFLDEQVVKVFAVLIVLTRLIA